MKGTIIERLLARVEITDSCWLWTGATAHGYGRIGIGGHGTASTHRVAYELLVGPIPPGLVLDHVCHNDDALCPGGECIHRRCVNPDHLEVVTQKVNTSRSGRVGRWAPARCRHGHEFTPENTRVRANGSRACRWCGRERYHRNAQRQRQQTNQTKEN